MAYIVIVVIIILIAYVHYQQKIIPGFWCISDDFKQQSEAEQLMFYFENGSCFSYNGYIILTSDGKELINETTTFTITPRGINTYTLNMALDTEYMPKMLIMDICPYRGIMTLKCPKDGKIYAKMLKNNQMSSEIILNLL